MDFSEYERKARETAAYPRMGSNIFYPALGLAGEAGEVADKVKKIIRDDNEILTPQRKDALVKELGDVLWYVAALGNELGVSMEEIARINLEKLASRKDRRQINGEGDDR